GHSFSGKSTCDRGMMIDLSPFRDVHVDPEARRARVTGGSLLGAVDHETMSHGLVTPLGAVSHPGVGGLVTGGGFGRLARRYGLSIDNLISVDVVTADGQLRHASESENPDLFWGVRGGGGNFGIVTSFEFRLHPLERQVLAGEVVFPMSRARDVLKLVADYGLVAPDELWIEPFLIFPPGGDAPVATIRICYSGAPAEAEQAIAPIRRLGGALADTVQPTDYTAVQRSGDYDDPRALGRYTKSGFIRDIPQHLVDVITDGLEGHPARTTLLVIPPNGGAINRVAADATALPQRDMLANMLCLVGWRHGDDPSEHIRWIKQFWTEIEPFTDGFYVNDLEVEHTDAAIQENYRRNHARLVAVKDRYDPTNLFRLNANVQPSAHTAKPPPQD
ncbi:MAG: FAD-binding oxidoreductase, partial [Vicinamibacteraceae bacterium]